MRFNVLVEFKELHWFCKKCDEIAIRAIRSFNPEKVSSLDVVQSNIRPACTQGVRGGSTEPAFLESQINFVSKH